MFEPDPAPFGAAPGNGSGTEPPPPVEPASGPTSFPLFSEAPFLTWYHQHRKSRYAHRIHSSCLPPIRLWDETDDA